MGCAMLVLENRVILELNKPNLNKRIYTTTCINSAINKINNGHLSGIIGGPIINPDSFNEFIWQGINLDDVSFNVDNLHVSEDILLGNITPVRKDLDSLLKEFHYRPFGIIWASHLDNGNTVIDDYSFISIILTDKPA